MEFKYRGAKYIVGEESVELAQDTAQTESTELTQHNRTAQYRGQTYQLPAYENVPAPQPVAEMSYRGVPYRTTVMGGTEVILSREQARKTKPAPMQLQSPSIVRRRMSQSDGISALQRRNILQSLKRRLMVAKAEGNRKLAYQLSQELQLLSQ
jgi:hypothetical protein